MEEVLKYIEQINDAIQQSKVLHRLIDIVAIGLFA